MQIANIDIFKEDFSKNLIVQQEIGKDLALYNKTNDRTKIEIGKDKIYEASYNKYCAHVALEALNESLDANQELKQENTEYKNKYGELDEVTRKKLSDSRQISTTNLSEERKREIYNKLKLAQKVIDKQLSKSNN